MKVFETAKWIWDVPNTQNKDEYVEFFKRIELNTGKKTVMRISCDGDYTLFINGKYVESNQYGDFEHYKIYDELDISEFIKDGENDFAVLVWHSGYNSSRYIVGVPGLIYEVLQGGKVCAVSDTDTLCRKSLAYKNGYEKIITYQLGYSFLYDATKEDDWTRGDGENFVPSAIQNKSTVFYARPNKKLLLKEKANATIVKQEENHILIDLGEETVGCPMLEFVSEKEQTIRIDFGEHIIDGRVRRIIGARDFSFEYVAKAGNNVYTNYMLRLGCRYLEVYSQYPIEVQYIGLIPQVYPVKKKSVALQNETDQKIYDLCVNTLQLCMMEHYVDCPWREQCLYAFDSRNQMLCGYYAFENGNAEYARSNLKLMSEDRRDDGLLSICYPCGVDLTIPSFSLYYFLAVREYIEHTGDVEFGKEIYPKLKSILEPFISNVQDGLICKFEGKNHWNFYDWSPYLNGKLHGTEDKIPDLIINTLFILALRHLCEIDKYLNNRFAFADLLETFIVRTKKAFFHQENGLFSILEGGSEYTVLGNALAVLAGLTSQEETAFICEKIIDGTLTECSLSMKAFKYDALLLADTQKYKGTVLSEIRHDYQVMLDVESTTVWETLDGAKAFGNAGSLCHGWSAIPIYYFHKLLNME